VPVTSSTGKPALPTHAFLPAGEGGLWRDSIALCEQVRTLEKARLGRRLGAVGADALRGIEKAILESDLGINPSNDGKSIRLLFPQLTEERRKELVKQIRKYAEGGKVAVRNIRRDAVDHFKKMQKASEITEDELKIAEKDLQKLTDDSCKEIDAILAAKEKELMSV